MFGNRTVEASPEPWLTPRTVATDVAITIAVIAPTVVRPLLDGRPLTVVDLVAGCATAALMVARRRWPATSFAIGLPAAVLLTVLAERPIGLLPAAVVLLFTVSVRFDRRTAVIAGAATLAGFLAVIAVLAPVGLFGIELLVGLAWPMLAVAAGEVVRNRRIAIGAAAERARQAEATREHETRRRVAEERLRIARELHDVVAHRIAVVNVQAGVAAHLVHSQPDEAQRALEVVRSSAGLVLEELSDILTVLRAPERDDGVHRDEPVEPIPSRAGVPALVESFALAGLQVAWETIGSPRSSPASVQLAV